ncbi:MAG: helix-turn-helix domain-containing protein [Propionibacteriaceae bacterium]|nr:helix-turn-helix domain-containing protein [Propionibacteriaceae bacterium]
MELLTPAEVATRLGMSRSSVLRRIADGTLKATKRVRGEGGIYCGRPGDPLAALSSSNARSSAIVVVRLARNPP